MKYKKHQKEIKERMGVVLDEGYFYESLTISQMKSVVAPVYKNWDEEKYQTLLKKFRLNENQKISRISTCGSNGTFNGSMWKDAIY